MLVLLGAFGILLGLLHKGQSFDQVRAKNKSMLPHLPFSQKTIHLTVCVATMFICAQSISLDTEGMEFFGYCGTVLSAIAGWLGSLVAGPAAKPAD